MFQKNTYISMVTHPCIMGLWALRLAPGVVPVAWCCAVMCYSRRGLCGPVSAVMSLELDGAILHISGVAGEVGDHDPPCRQRHQPGERRSVAAGGGGIA